MIAFHPSDVAVIAPAFPGPLPVSQIDAWRSMVSMDGQVYVIDRDSQLEFRIAPTTLAEAFDVVASSYSASKPPDPDALPLKLIRHLQYEHTVCVDCDEPSQGFYFVWSSRRCPNCGSARLRVDRRSLSQPFAETIAESRQAIHELHVHGSIDLDRCHIWKRDLHHDAARLSRATLLEQDSDPRAAAILQLELFFSESVIASATAAEAYDMQAFRVAQSDVALEIFLQISDLHAGNKAFQLAVNALDADTNEHGQFLANKQLVKVVSTLSERLSVDVVAILIGSNNSKSRAITAARYLPELLSFIPDDWMYHRASQEILCDYYLAQALCIGNSSDAELGEAVSLLRKAIDRRNELLQKEALSEYMQQEDTPGDLAIANEVLSHLEYHGGGDPRLVPFLDSSRDNLDFTWAQAMIRWVFLSPTEERTALLPDVVSQLSDMIDCEDVRKFRYRWKWAYLRGLATLEVGADLVAMYWLQASVTFCLRDRLIHSDNMREVSDSEAMFVAFAALARLYTKLGWGAEALALLETMRGVSLKLATTSDEKIEKARDKLRNGHALLLDDLSLGHYGVADTMKLADEKAMRDAGHLWERFGGDYELPGLQKRMIRLFRKSLSKRSALVSFNVEYSTLRDVYIISIVVVGYPATPYWSGARHIKEVSEAEWRALVDPDRLQVSSFREGRLRELCDRLHQTVVHPVVATLREWGCSKIVVVGPSALSNWPLEAALVEHGGGSCSQIRVAYLPSITFGSKTKKLGRSKKPRILVVGYADDDLTHARDEATELLDIFEGRGTYLEGDQCTKLRVIEELNRGYEYVHVICHGTYDAMFPEDSALLFTRDRENDGRRVTAREIRESVRLRKTRLVTLSACSTALTADSRTNTWHGLPGTLLSVGAKAIVGTRWPVADRVSKEMMRGLYLGVVEREKKPVEAYWEAQEHIRADGRVEEWACFGYLGSVR